MSPLYVITPDGSVDQSFITYQGDINSVKASDYALVVLLLSPKGILLMYDWTGTPIRTRSVSDKGGAYGSRLSIYNNQIHILDGSSQSMMVYSFDIDLLKTVKSDHFSASDHTSFTQCGSDLLVVTSRHGKTFVVNHNAGQVLP